MVPFKILVLNIEKIFFYVNLASSKHAKFTLRMFCRFLEIFYIDTSCLSPRIFLSLAFEILCHLYVFLALLHLLYLKTV